MLPSTPYAREPDLAGDGGDVAGLGVVVPASTFELGSVGPASGDEPHPAISIAIATAIAIRRRCERIGLISTWGGSQVRARAHLLSQFSCGEDGEGGGLRTAGTR